MENGYREIAVKEQKPHHVRQRVDLGRLVVFIDEAQASESIGAVNIPIYTVIYV